MKLRKKLKVLRNSFLVRGKQKVFCIGKNKTGTTSLKQAFKDLGFIVGVQKSAEELLPYFVNQEFDRIIRYCHTAQVFQDFPFSFPEFYKLLYERFPNSKFILSVRDNPEQWYNSYVKFYSKLAGCQVGVIASTEQLKSCEYIYRGWLWEFHSASFPVSTDDPFNKDILIHEYEQHIRDVLDFFTTKPEKLLVLNLTQPSGYKEFLNFLGVESSRTEFPWEKRNTR